MYIYIFKIITSSPQLFGSATFKEWERHAKKNTCSLNPCWSGTSLPVSQVSANVGVTVDPQAPREMGSTKTFGLVSATI